MSALDLEVREYLESRFKEVNDKLDEAHSQRAAQNERLARLTANQENHDTKLREGLGNTTAYIDGVERRAHERIKAIEGREWRSAGAILAALGALAMHALRLR